MDILSDERMEEILPFQGSIFSLWWELQEDDCSLTDASEHSAELEPGEYTHEPGPELTLVAELLESPAQTSGCSGIAGPIHACSLTDPHVKRQF